MGAYGSALGGIASGAAGLIGAAVGLGVGGPLGAAIGAAVVGRAMDVGFGAMWGGATSGSGGRRPDGGRSIW